MRLLLDSQALLWTLFDQAKLSVSARTTLEDTANTVFVSTISPYELETKKAARRLNYPQVPDWERATAQAGFHLLPITIAHGVAAAHLPRLHGDPWDRLLIGQATIEVLTLITSDRKIPHYQIPTLW